VFVCGTAARGASFRTTPATIRPSTTPIAASFGVGDFLRAARGWPLGQHRELPVRLHVDRSSVHEPLKATAK